MTRLSRAASDRLARRRESVDALAGRLEVLSPLRVLSRGYSLTRKSGESACLRDAAALTPGDAIETVLARGRVVSRVETIECEEEDRP